ncbi:MAG: YkgJ family cysteine cluster protein [Victivallales bacterium]|nr:YkgJ family cysteine cluster protein [Victivallales bacterium]
MKPGKESKRQNGAKTSTSNMAFTCDKCGLCCRRIKDIPQLEAFDRGDGVCIHLKDNLCDIYEHRPEICDTERMYRYLASSISREDYEKLLTDSCRCLKENLANSEDITEKTSREFRDKLRKKLDGISANT